MIGYMNIFLMGNSHVLCVNQVVAGLLFYIRFLKIADVHE